MHAPRAAGAGFLLLLLSSAGSGQQPAPPQPTFRAATMFVEVDVVVRDNAGAFVADLQPSDFEVFEDGVRQEIAALYRVLGPDIKAPAASPEAATSPAHSVAPPPPSQIQRVLVFYFDQLHLSPGGFDRVRKAALEFLATGFRQGDIGGVANGATIVNGRLSNVREELEAAMRSIKPAGDSGNRQQSLREWPRFVDAGEALRIERNESGALETIVQRACRDDPDACSKGGGRDFVESQVHGKALHLVAEARAAGKQTLDTVSALANGLGRLPGRKTIVLLSDGFFVESSWADLRQVVGRAARASVRIYALDTRGLNRGSAGSDILNATSPSEIGVALPGVDSVADGPNSLAVDTGGFVIRNENNFGKALGEIDRDTSSYYVVGYRPRVEPDGKYRSISVRVTRPGVKVRARKGYVATPEMLKAGPSGAAPAPVPPAGQPEIVPPVGGRPAPVEKPAGPPPVVAQPAAGDKAEVAGKIGEPQPDAEANAAPAAMRMRPNVGDEVAVLTKGSGGSTADAALPPALARKATEGWDAYQRGDLATAKTALSLAAAHAAAPPWIQYALGWAQFALAETSPAAENWERVRLAVPQFRTVYFDLADAYLQQRDYGKAVSVLRAAEGRWPKDVEVYNALGVIQLARGAINDAVETFEKAVSVDASDATASYNLARTYELRFVRSGRLRRVGPGTVNVGEVVQDRDRAVDYYRRVVLLGGPLADAARQGLERLGAAAK